MKVKDYMRLGRISLKARKKSTRGTVRGISFGLILLMPLFFLVLAFYIGLNSSVDKEPAIRVFTIDYYNKINDSENNYYNYNRGILSSDMTTVKAIKGVDRYIDFIDYNFKLNVSSDSDETSLSYSIDDGEFIICKKPISTTEDEDRNNSYYSSNSKNNTVFKVIDIKNSNGLFLPQDYEKNNPLIAGNEFSENPKNEIMVSTKFLSDNNLDNSIVGKNLSLKYEVSSSSDSNVTTNETTYEVLNVSGADVPLFKNFKVVGIYDSSILKSRESNENEYFWMSKESFVDSSNQSSLPRIVSIQDQYNENYTRNYYFYQDSKVVKLANSYIDQGCAFFPLGLTGSGNINDTFVTTEYLSFNSYGRASNAVDKIKDLYKKVINNDNHEVSELEFSTQAFFLYRLFYTIFMYLSFGLGIFGGVIFFATLLNLYNTINFSVQIRKNYLGLLRAVGMKDNDITKMYFFEIIQIFLRSYIWTIIFGGIICGGINFGFNFAMNIKEVKEIMPFTMSLNPIYILVSFVVLALITFIIALIFAFVACYNVSRKPILEVLVDDK